MGTPHEKQHIRPRDWVVTCLVWCALLVVTLLNWRLANFIQLKRDADTRQFKAAGRRPQLSPNGSMSFNFPTHVQSAPIRWLLQRDALTIVNVTAALIWFTLVLDTISWTYTVTFEVWDWLVIIVDGVCVAFGGLSAALLLVVFMQRAFSTFDSTPFQYSARMYNVMGTLILLVAILAIITGAFTCALQWTLVFVSVSVFVILYWFTCSLLIWMLFSPLRKLAFELKKEDILHVAVRITFLSVLTLVTSSITFLLVIVAYSYCDECVLTYGYYCFANIDSVLNVLCLTWSLKYGQKEYSKVCSCVHTRLFEQLKSIENEAETDVGL